MFCEFGEDFEKFFWNFFFKENEIGLERSIFNNVFG